MSIISERWKPRVTVFVRTVDSTSGPIKRYDWLEPTGATAMAYSEAEAARRIGPHTDLVFVDVATPSGAVETFPPASPAPEGAA